MGPTPPAREPTGVTGVDLLWLTPQDDQRGCFLELVRNAWLEPHVPLQWNLVVSGPSVLRGMHWHESHTDYLAVVGGELLVALADLRIGSPTEGAHELLRLALGRPAVLAIPVGVAHGFWTACSSAVLYGVTRYWDPYDEFGVWWNDPALGIAWPPEVREPVLSERDRTLPRLGEGRPLPLFELADLERRAQLGDGAHDSEALAARGARRGASGAVGDEVA